MARSLWGPPWLIGRWSNRKLKQDNADYEYVYLTGSHIPQRVMKRNIITVGRNGPVLTIDQKEMERNGNQPIAEQLSRYPGIQIRSLIECLFTGREWPSARRFSQLASGWQSLCLPFEAVEIALRH